MAIFAHISIAKHRTVKIASGNLIMQCNVWWTHLAGSYNKAFSRECYKFLHMLIKDLWKQ